MAHRASVKALHGRLAEGASPIKSKGASVEAPAGALEAGARFLLVLVFSSLGMGQPLNRGHFKNLTAGVSS